MFKNFEPQNTSGHSNTTEENYTVVLNSNLSTGTLAGAMFNFDWSILPDRNYMVHYTFNTANMSLSTGKVCLISSDLFASSNTYIASATGGRTTAQSSNILGVAYPYIYGATSALHAEDGTAPPLYLNTRPVLNQFMIQVQTADATPIDYPGLSSWVLVLHFKPVDKSGRELL